MPASYPSSVKTFTTKQDGVDRVAAAHVNDLQAEVVAIETELGTNPSGASADVAARLTADEAAIDALEALNPRERLTAARTYYVRTDGNDSNTGLANTAGGAFLTWQKAWDTVVGLDQNANTVTIQVGDGTYTAGISTTVTPTGPVVINGNSGTPANVVLSTTSASGISLNCAARVTVQNFKVQTTTGGHGLLALAGSQITVGAGMNFGSCAYSHIHAANGGYIFCASSYTVSGGANYHMQGQMNGKFEYASLTITLSGTPAFSGAFVYLDLACVMSAYAITFSGGATGARYAASMNSVIQTYGGGANYFPGNSAGSTATGGQYA